MAGERTLPGLGLTGFWDLGSDGWKNANDVNLRVLSAVAQLSVISMTTSLPTGSNGDIYIIPDGDTDEFKVAVKDNGAWVLLTPQEGWRAWVKDTNRNVVFDGSVWGDGQAWLGIGGGQPDANARLVVISPTVNFIHDGDDMIINVNKAASGDKAIFSFLDNWSGRALFGLNESDAFSLSVSADGSAFHPAMNFHPGTGHVGFNGFTADTNNAIGAKGTAFLFDAETDDCRFTFNKVAAGDDAALTFQSNYSGRALIGLLGSDDFSFTVSPDGSSYTQAILIDKDDASVSLVQHPKFFGYCNYDQYNAADAWFTVDINNAEVNDQGDLSGGVFTAPHAGYYMFGAGVRLLSDGTPPTNVILGFSLNNANPVPRRSSINGEGSATMDNFSAVTVTTLMKLAAGDTVRVKAFFTSGDSSLDADYSYFHGCQIA